jgi:hypothetical protein
MQDDCSGGLADIISHLENQDAGADLDQDTHIGLAATAAHATKGTT